MERMRSLVTHAPRGAVEKDVNGSVDLHIEGTNPGYLEDSLGRLIVEEERSRYVSGSSWQNLADQVPNSHTCDSNSGD